LESLVANKVFGSQKKMQLSVFRRLPVVLASLAHSSLHASILLA